MSSAVGGPAATEPDPDAIAAAVLGCPAVAGLSGGVGGVVATYLPGRRVTGLRIDDATVTVHVVGRYGPPMTEISDQVARAVSPLAGGRQVGVVVEDLLLDGGAVQGTVPPAGTGSPDPRPAPAVPQAR